MRTEFKQAKTSFWRPWRKPITDEREAFWREACGEDAALRRQVDALLRRHEDAGSFLEQPAFERSGHRLVRARPCGRAASPAAC